MISLVLDIGDSLCRIISVNCVPHHIIVNVALVINFVIVNRGLLFVLPEFFPNAELSVTKKSLPEPAFKAIIDKLSVGYPEQVRCFLLALWSLKRQVWVVFDRGKGERVPAK